MEATLFFVCARQKFCVIPVPDGHTNLKNQMLY